jgi:hypothetical protein
LNYCQTKYNSEKRNETGSTLLVIIIAMLVIAVLSAAIYSLTYTAALNQVAAQRAARAFYLAESGIRIAQSEYRAAVTVGGGVEEPKAAAVSPCFLAIE